MNKTHRLVWHETTRTWVATAETARSRGKRSTGVLAIACALLPPAALAQVAPTTLPSGGQVTAGQASIQQNGAAMTIQQGSDRAAIDWQQFNVGRDASVRFQQPSPQSVTLNRVQGPDASQIFGRITANGQVFLSNPNGVYFAPGASVDVGGLVATTHRISLDDFMAGRTRFERQGAAGSVINEGELRAALGGYIALLAPEVRNQGLVIANLGTVALAAGEAFELQFDANHTLAGLRVEASTLRTLVDNRSAVLAPGGLVILSAQALDRVQGGVVRNSGRIEATGLAQRGGRILLEASGQIGNSGSISASATAEGPAGSVRLQAPEVTNSGSITATGSLAHPQGGRIEIAAGDLLQTTTGVIDAGAAAAGGRVAIRASGTVTLAGRVAAQATQDLAAPTAAPVAAAAPAPQPAAAEAPTQGGEINIQAAQITLASATLDAAGGQGGHIVLDASAAVPAAPPAPQPAPAPGKTALLGSTQLSTRGRRGGGGGLTLLGDDIALQDHTALDASGSTGGGTVRAGGGWQGTGGWHQATTVTMGADARIDASATEQGDGGTVVLWSDVHRADGQTTAAGSLRARGGVQGGDGGRIETSGHAVATDGLRVDAGAGSGRGGLWLIDPYDYTIGSTQAAVIVTALNGGTSVIVDTSVNNTTQGSSGNSSNVGTITLGSTISKTSGNDATLTLQADGDILFAGAGVRSTVGKLNLVLIADRDSSNGGAIKLDGSTTPISIVTNGGNVWMGGSNSGPARSGTAGTPGILLHGTSIDTGAGNIYIAGQEIPSSAATNLTSSGVRLLNASLTTTSGNIEIIGSVNGAFDRAAAVHLVASGGNTTLQTDSGTVTVTGSGQDNNSAGSGWRHGILLLGATAGHSVTLRSSSGAITLNGTAAYTDARTNDTSGLQLQTDNAASRVQVVSQSGAITLKGSNNQEVSQNENAIRFNAQDASNNISIGFDGSTAYSGNILIEGNSLQQANQHAGAGSIAVQTSGTLTFQSTGTSFTQLRAGTGALTFDNDWNFGAQLGKFTLGKETNTANLTLSNALSTQGPIQLHGGNINLNANLTSTLAGSGILAKASGNIVLADGLTLQTNGGHITLWADSDGSGEGYIQLLNNTLDSRTATARAANVEASNGTSASGGGHIVLAGGSDDGSNGGTVGDGMPDGFASSSVASGIMLGPTSGAGASRLYAGGGNVVLRGRATGSSNMGVQWNKAGTVAAGVGTVSITGTASQGHGIELGALSGSTTISAGGGNAAQPAIRLEGSTASTGHLGLQTNGGSLLATGTGGITVSGTAPSGGGSHANNLGLHALAASGPIELSASGGLGLRYGGTLGKLASTGVTASSSNITLTGDALAVNGSIAVDSTGTLTVQPFNASFSSALSWPLANFTVANITGLTLGKPGNTADITVTAAQTIAGPIRLYGGNLTLAAGLTATGNTVTLQASGTVSDTGSGFVSASELLLLGGNVLLDSASTSIGTLAAGGVGSLDLRNNGALTIGTVDGTTGISATGTVAVSTQSGDLTLAASVATTNTGPSAIVLNAGRAAAAGTAAGGNLIVSGDPNLITGTGGRATLYSGAVADSTGLTARVGGGSGRFRYNSDESSSNFSTALVSGLYAIYREQPTVALGWDSLSMVYGAALPTSGFTVTSGSLVNGDAPTASLVGAVLSGAGQLAVSGSPYTVQDSSALQALGYNATVSNGSLAVTPRSLVAGFTGVDKVYDGGQATTVTLDDNRLAGDVLSLAYGSASFLDKQAGTGKTVNVGGVTLTGADAGNYTLDATSGSTTAAITPRNLTVTWSGIDKVYDGTATASVGASDNRLGGDLLSITRSAAFADAHAGSGKAVNVTGVSLSGTDALNYSVAATGSTTAAITPKPLTLSAAKVYDGTATLGAGSVTLGGLVGSETLSYSGATASNAHVATTGKFISALTLADGTDGGRVGNYALPALNAANAPVDITPKALTAAATIGGTLTKVYDGSTAASGAGVSGSVSGAIVGDTLALDTSGLALAYDSSHVAGATQIAASGSAGFTISASTLGSQPSDYQFNGPTVAPVAAQITPATLTATLANSGVSKVYDGSTAAPAGFAPAWTIGGLVAGDTGATLSHTNAAYDSKDVAQASRLTVSGMAIGAIAGSNGSQASDYQLGSTQQQVAAGITPKTLTVVGLAAAAKVYDGTDDASLTQIGSLSGLVGSENLGLSVAHAAFDSANAGSGKTVTASGYLLSNGSGAGAGLASNYQLASTSATTTADVTKALLTVIANNDARFVTQADTAGYNGVIYSGFVHGETAAVLGGAADVVRTNPGDNLAGSYAGVLVPDTSGLTSGNYSFQVRSGNFTIVPAGQLLVRVAPTTTAYGNASNYTLSSAQYLDNGNVIHNVSITPAGGGRFTLDDGVGGSATLTLVPDGAGTSSAGWTRVGAWQLAATDVSTQNAFNFSNTLTLVGSETVVQRAVNVSAGAGISKVYDGTVGMQGLRVDLAGTEAADQVSVSATGTFTSKNAGNQLAYTVTGVALAGADAGNYYLASGGTFGGTNGSITPRSLNAGYTGVNKVYDGNTTAAVTITDDRLAGDVLTVQVAANFSDKNVGSGKLVTVTGATLAGTDAGNYTLTSTGGSTTADITRLSSVTWTGGANGNWFDPANWAGGAVPDLANVANVVIPAGVVVRFDTAGAVAPAQTGPVQIDSLGSAGGGLVQADGTLDVGSGGVQLNSLTQQGGALTSVGDIAVNNFSQTGGSTTTQGNLTVDGQFSQGPNGSVTVGGNTTITDTAGGATLGNLQTGGNLAITSTGGDITQAAGTTIVTNGTTTLDAPGSNITLDGANNDFGGAFNATGNNVTVVDGTGGLVIGNIDAAGDLNATSTGGDVTQQAGSAINVAGQTTVDALGSNITLDGANNDFGGAFNATGNTVTVVDGTGGLVIGNIDAAGDLNATSTGGDVTQQAGSAIDVVGQTTVDALGSDITLDGANNDFGGAFNATGNTVTVVDGTGGLVIGNIDAAGDLNATSTGGDVTQQAGSAINVAGQTTVDALGSNITLDGANNDFKGPFNATGNTVTVVDGTGGLVIGNIDAAGDLNATSTGGDVTQQAGSAINVAGQTTVDALGSDITLDGANNDFGGAFNATGNNVTVVDGTGGLVIGNIDAAGDLNATSTGGDVTQQAGSAINVAGQTTVDALGSNITLDGANNDFGGAFNATGNNVTVVDGTGGLVIGNIDAAGDLNATSTGGDVTQQAGSAINVAGQTTVDALGSNITLDGANNDFGGAFNATGNNVTVVDGTGGLVIGNIDAAGDLNATSTGGDVTQQAGSAINVAGQTTVDALGSNITLNGANNDFKGPFNATGNNVTVVDGTGGLVIGNIAANGNLNATSTGGNISQQPGSAINVAGQTTVDALGSDITLDGANNDFKGPFNATGNNVTVVDGTGGLVIGNIAANGDLNATSTGGDVTQQAGSAINVAGQTTVDALGSNITLDGANNDFKGPFNATGNNVTVVDGTGGLVIGNITAAGDLNATSTRGDVTQQAGSAINVAGQTTVDALGSNITLDGANNDFKGPFNATGNNVTVVDGTGGLVIGNITAAGDLNATSTGGNISQLPGSSLVVAGDSALAAPGSRIELASVGNSFGGDLLLNGTSSGSAATVPPVVPPVAAPAALPAPDTAPPAIEAPALRTGPAGSSASPTGGSATAAQSLTDGVAVSVVVDPRAQGTALVTVQVTQQRLVTGFSFAVPEAVTGGLPADTSVTATLDSGEPLPAWLRFDAQRRQFSADTVPEGGLPLRVRLRMGERVVIIVVTVAAARSGS